MQYTYIASKIYEWVVYTCILFYVASCFGLRDRFLCFCGNCCRTKNGHGDTWLVGFYDWSYFLKRFTFYYII